MSERNRLTRREFLRLSGGAAVASLVAACAGGAPQPTATPAPAAPEAKPTPTPAEEVPTTKYKEAPQLAELVKQGKLPPVDERLPENPLVVQPVDRIGQYGGTWRTALRGGADNAWLLRTMDYEYLVRWDPDWTKVIPNLAESFEANEDATEFTFHLRKGVKWSDGEPFTADDIMFWYEDVFMNEDLTPVKTSWLVTGDEPVTVEKVDDYTVKFKFAAPNGLFLQRMATPSGSYITRFPRHYLEQFHIKYNPDNIDKLIEEAGATDWVNLFQLKGSGVPGTPYDARWQNKELPSLNAWILTTAYGEGTRVVAERNPYYWKVDPEGNQLPYLDRIVYEVGEDVEVLVLKALNGEIDMQDRHIAKPANKAVFVDNMEKGGYHFFEKIPSSMNMLIIALNLTHKDPKMREIFQNKHFRIGLSYAINRQEIIDLVWVGAGEPFQAAPRPESPFYNERLAKQYTEYDVDKANEHLDMVLPEKDDEGFRLRPDGERLSFSIEVAATQTDRIDALELIRGYWKAVGIDMQVKTEDRSILYTRKEANEHDAVVWGGDGGLDVILEPRWYFPYSAESNYAELWQFWYNKDPRGEEPPEPTKKQMELYDQLKATGDPDKQADLMKQILEIAADQFYVIGISLPPKGYGIVKNNFHNVPKVMPGSWLYPNPAPTNPCQYFKDPID
ncbi:MAG: ABC transporter substrate-binding protein [Chloroflexi bacterium]|nr:ABC transporter substrate-binding protein [Chloroflexota bacterium]